jgi:hypothetical protein
MFSFNAICQCYNSKEVQNSYVLAFKITKIRNITIKLVDNLNILLEENKNNKTNV